MMKNKWMPSIIFGLVIIMGYFLWNPSTEESITYFPPNPTLTFKDASTTLVVKPNDNLDYFTLAYESQSVLPTEVYLRQDIGVVYFNGLLQVATTQWKRNASTIKLSSSVKETTGGLAEAFTFHHGEEHDGDDEITSVQTISSAEVGVVFKKGTSPKEISLNENSPFLKEKKNREQQIVDSFDREKEPVENYLILTLSDISRNDFIFPGQSEVQSKATLGRLMEGLYKELFLLATKKSTASTEGSTLPIILYAKDSSHLKVISKKLDGTWIELRQNITP
ncbi:hypothetical protein [Mangrovibacillus cuniculi]|uniref:Uncharacterized protein n=1 Tax=Mangrovibacillus cuniculi TaxID=2593652 RepID=A0A7S8CBD7_9BACI|nr:hypothetical protein [Mangrovibacillus cuniculi]QPC46874.1 hypothetical protein G8O30_07820 [Mangrovibacillus cuniculi]